MLSIHNRRVNNRIDKKNILSTCRTVVSSYEDRVTKTLYRSQKRCGETKPDSLTLDEMSKRSRSQPTPLLVVPTSPTRSSREEATLLRMFKR